MNITLRILSPAIVSACLALPLITSHAQSPVPQILGDKPSTSGGAGDHPNQVAGEYTNPSGAGTFDRSAKGYADHMDTGSLGHVARSSEVIGLEVRNLQEEKLGKVNELAVDLASGRIVEVIVSSGGVLGVGSSMFAVPPAAFHYDSEAKVLHLDRTKESLKSLPPFDVAQWDTHFQATNVVAVYREYGVNPYFTTAVGAVEGGGSSRRASRGTALNRDERRNSGDAADADNTALNRRDKDGGTLTPGDQGNSASDLAITARIRKAVMAHDGLSVNAKNVKIITLNGHVTLRGPVNSEAEKLAIAGIAESAVEPASVDNQLEVKH